MKQNTLLHDWIFNQPLASWSWKEFPHLSYQQAWSVTILLQAIATVVHENSQFVLMEGISIVAKENSQSIIDVVIMQWSYTLIHIWMFNQPFMSRNFYTYHIFPFFLTLVVLIKCYNIEYVGCGAWLSYVFRGITTLDPSSLGTNLMVEVMFNLCFFSLEGNPSLYMRELYCIYIDPYFEWERERRLCESEEGITTDLL